MKDYKIGHLLHRIPSVALLLLMGLIFHQEEGYAQSYGQSQAQGNTQSMTSEEQSEQDFYESDSLQVYFRQSRTELDPSFRNNHIRLERFARRFEQFYRDPSKKVTGIRIVSSASPEGSVQVNERVSSARANSIAQFMSQNFSIAPHLFEVVSLDANWKELQEMVEKAYSMPYQREVLEVLRSSIPLYGYLDEDSSQRLKRRLGEIGGGTAWNYMYNHFFPELRRTIVHIAYEGDKKPEPAPQPAIEVVEKTDTLVVLQTDTLTLLERDTVFLEVPVPSDPFYMALRTNLLADLALIPNIGAEFYLGDNFSLLGSWTHAWWHNDPKHRYWRIYGADLELRKYFGRLAGEKPLQGHHAGLYGQWYSWDFEWGKRAFKAAEGTWTVGLSYGYSLPISRRLNLDFGIGIGYMWGEYEEGLPYVLPDKNLYVWQVTKRMRYFGPTKVGVTLTWLLGNGNYNQSKKK